MMTRPKNPIITLTTDFGLRDSYVAVMKGVILGICPSATLVDVSHEVPPQDVVSGAQLLAGIWRYYPTHTIHLAVVDPGVGTARRPIAVATDNGIFIGPDNGLLALALVRMGAADAETGELVSAQGVHLTNPQFHAAAISQTFHGRDLFAPVAAHLAAGAAFSQLGQPIDTVAPLQRPQASVRDGLVEGVVVRVDRFGNLITNIEKQLLPDSLVIEIGNIRIRRLSRSYQDGDLVALIGSHGNLEIAVRNGSAEHLLNASRGTPVRVETVR